MNTSRLLEITQLLLDIEKRKKIQTTLTTLSSALSSLAGSPSQESYQTEFAKALDNVRTVMSEVRSTFQPAQVTMIEEIGALRYFADDVATEIAGWTAANVATPAVARDKLAKFIAEREAYITQITQLRENLKRVGITVDNLEPGEAEIGFLLPRSLFNNQFEPLLKELNVVKNIIRTFSEAANGSAEKIEVRQISTSDPLFSFGLNPATIAMLGAAITWALNTWKQVEEIRKIRADTSKIEALTGSPIEALFKDTIESSVQKAIADQTAEFMKLVTGDTARKNEQKESLEWALESIVTRVERGMTVEIRLLPPPTAPAKEGEPPPPPPPPVYEELKVLSGQLLFPKMMGEPILKLPSPEPHHTPKKPTAGKQV